MQFGLIIFVNLRFEFHALPAPSMLDEVEESSTLIWHVDDLDRILHRLI